MRAIQIAYFVFAWVLAVGILNSSGIFEEQLPNRDVDIPNSANLSTGVTDISNGVLEEGDAASAFDGWKVVGTMTSTLFEVLSVLVLPGRILIDFGFPVAFALAVQAMVSLTELIGILQFLSNRSLSGME